MNEKTANGGAWLPYGMVGILFAGLAVIAWPMLRSATPPSGGAAENSLVIIDTDRLLRAQVGMTIKTGVGDPIAFANQMRQAVHDLAAQGKVVINAQVAMAYPASSDQTAELARKLHIDLNAAEAAEVEAAAAAKPASTAAVTP